MADDQLLKLSEKLGQALKHRGWMLVLAESCTGGMAAQYVTATAGSAEWFDAGFITYSNEAKMTLLAVSAHTLDSHGAVSEKTAQEMAAGALKNSKAHIAAAITGIAGPDGGTTAKPVGTVCFAWVTAEGEKLSRTCQFNGDRESIRKESVKTVFEQLISLTLPPDL